jgi:hypothetical protein
VVSAASSLLLGLVLVFIAARVYRRESLLV